MSPTAHAISPQAQEGQGLARADSQAALASILDNPHLPTPPALALQIVDKASRADCDPKEIIRLLSQDPGLCGKLLQAVNSSAFGLTRPVASLERAVTITGMKSLRSLVLGWSLSAIHTDERDKDVWRYWQESVAGAVMARELAVLARRPDPEDDLVAGLLRDLGVLVLRQVFPEEYQALSAQPCNGAELCRAEERAFGLDHCEVSAGLLNDWNLPAEVVEPIRHHHAPERCAEQSKEVVERTWLLYLASELARLNSRVPGQLGPLSLVARQRFGINPGVLGGFLGQIMPRIEKFAALLKMDIGKSSDFAAVIAAGCKELVQLSTQTHSATGAAPGREPSPATPAPQPGLDETTVTRRIVPVAAASAPAPEIAHLPDFDASGLRHLPPGGMRLHNYHLQEVLGRGAMGVVFKALDPMLNRFVAIKMLHPERVALSEARERFLREARMSAAIQHENVITIHAIGDVNGLPYLVMEYLPGSSLEERLLEEKLVPMPQVLDYARQIASGLQAAHARGVIHRDVKPANILIAKETGRIKITDFGLARLRDGVAFTQAGLWVGTPLFMSPEQFQGEKIDHRADLFALGSLLYTLATSQTPFEGDSIMVLMRQICETQPAPIRSVRADVPIWLADLIAKLHAKKPAERPASAAEVVETIDRHGKKAG